MIPPIAHFLAAVNQVLQKAPQFNKKEDKEKADKQTKNEKLVKK